jgi:hypothetical protein
VGAYDAGMIKLAGPYPPLPVSVVSIALIAEAVFRAFRPTPGRHYLATVIIVTTVAIGFKLALAYGLFRGRAVARTLVVVLIAYNLVTGLLRFGVADGQSAAIAGGELALLGLLLLPGSARRWFRQPHSRPASAPPQVTDTGEQGPPSSQWVPY